MSGICLLITPVPVHCFSITSTVIEFYTLLMLVVRTHIYAKRHRARLKNEVALLMSSLSSSPAIVRNASILNLPEFVSIC